MNTESVMFEQNNLASNMGAIYKKLKKSGTDEIEMAASPPKISGLCWHKFRAFKSYSLVFDIK